MANINPVDWAAYAMKRNAEVAQLTDDRLYKSLHGRELRDAAREAVRNPIICTAKEFGARYGHLLPSSAAWRHVADMEPNKVFLWCFTISWRYYSATKRVDIVPEVVGNL